MSIAASLPIQTSAASDSTDIRLLTSAAAAAADNRSDSGVAPGGGTKPASALRAAAAAAAAVPQISVTDNTLELEASGVGASAHKQPTEPEDAAQHEGSRQPALGATMRPDPLLAGGADDDDDVSDDGSDGSIGSYLEQDDDGDARFRDTTDDEVRCTPLIVPVRPAGCDARPGTNNEQNSQPFLATCDWTDPKLKLRDAPHRPPPTAHVPTQRAHFVPSDRFPSPSQTLPQAVTELDALGLTIAEQLDEMSDEDHDNDSIDSGGGTPVSSGDPLTMSQLDKESTASVLITTAPAPAPAPAPSPQSPATPAPVPRQHQDRQPSTAGLGLSETLPWSPAANETRKENEATDTGAEYSAPTLPSPSTPPLSPPSAMKQTVPWSPGVESLGAYPTPPPNRPAAEESGPALLPANPDMPPLGASLMASSNLAATTFGDPEEEDDEVFSPFDSPERPLAATIVPSTAPRQPQSAASPSLTPGSRKRWRHHPPPLPYLGLPLFPKALAVDLKMATVPELTYGQLEALRPLFAGNAKAEASASLSPTDGTWIASEYLRLECYDEALAVLHSAAPAADSPAAAASLETVRGFAFAGLRNLASAIRSFDAAILKRDEHLRQAGTSPEHAARDVDTLELLVNRAICHLQLNQPRAVITALTPVLDKLAGVALESTTTGFVCARGTARYLVGRAHLDLATSGDPDHPRTTNADRTEAVGILELALEDAKVLLVARSAGPLRLSLYTPHDDVTSRSLADSVMHPAVRNQLDEAMAVVHMHIGSAFMLVGDRNVPEATRMFDTARVLLNGPDTRTLTLEGQGLIAVNDSQPDQVDPLLNLILAVQTAYTLAETVRYEQVPELGRSLLPEMMGFFGITAHHEPQKIASVTFYNVVGQLHDVLHKIEEADGLGGRL